MTGLDRKNEALGHEKGALGTTRGVWAMKMWVWTLRMASWKRKKRLFVLTVGVENLKIKLWALKEGYGG